MLLELPPEHNIRYTNPLQPQKMTGQHQGYIYHRHGLQSVNLASFDRLIDGSMYLYRLPTVCHQNRTTD